MSEHVHKFSVDTSCDCGVVLSAYVKSLYTEVAALKDSYTAEHTRAVMLSAGWKETNRQFEESQNTNALLRAVAEAAILVRKREKARPPREAFSYERWADAQTEADDALDAVLDRACPGWREKA